MRSGPCNILFNEVQLGRFARARAAARIHAIGERLGDNRLCRCAAWMTGAPGHGAGRLAPLKT
jgi:hypothetical protein